MTFSSLDDIIKSTHAIDAKGGRLPIGIPGRLQIGMHGRLRRYPQADIVYREKLDAMARSDGNLHVVYTLTREQPKDWTGHRGRIDRALLVANCFPPAQNPAIYVCGPTAFVEAVSGFLVELGFDPLNIKTERFGPSGG